MRRANPEKMTFRRLADEWLLFKKYKIKESSYLAYKYVVEQKFVKEFGRKTLVELTHYNFNRYIEKLLRRLSSKTVKNMISILKEILRYAEVKYDLNFKLSLIASPSIKKFDIGVFGDKERTKLERFSMFKTKDLRHLGILISLYSGLRIGEVCALRWRDIDFETKTICVTHTLQRVYDAKNKTKIIYTDPKTESSIRKIPMAKPLHRILRELSVDYSPNAFVLTGKPRQWVEPMMLRYLYKIVLKKLKIKYRKFHCLRHTFATRCIKVGMDVKSLSEVLGHANVSVTLNIYVHSSNNTKRKFINRL